MPQIVPSPDAFDHGTPVYGDVVAGYLALRPTTAYTISRLHNGYAPAAAARYVSGTQGTGAGFVRRETFPEDCRVRAVLRKAAVTGTPQALHLKRHGVYARITGGTLANASTAEVNLHSITGYGFEITDIGGGDQSLRLVRYNAGTATPLAEMAASTVFPGSWTDAHDVILTVDTQTDGSVQLRAEIGGFIFASTQAASGNTGGYLGQAGGSGIHGGSYTASGQPKKRGAVPLVPPDDYFHPVPPTSIGGPTGPTTVYTAGPVLVLTATDPVGTALTGDGRCGFVLDHEQAQSGVQTYSACSLFQVEDLTIPTLPVVVWRDEWTRTALLRAETDSDQFGTPCRTIQDDYSTGRWSDLPTGDMLQRSTGTETAEMADNIDFGQGVDLDGVDGELDLATPSGAYPTPASSSVLQFTVILWVKLGTNTDGNFFSAFTNDAATLTSEWDWGWIDDGAGNARIRFRVGSGTANAPHAYSSDSFSATPYVGQIWAYVLSYKANANPSNGSGRVRFYVGRFGTATLLKELTVTSTHRPSWLGSGQPHRIGQRKPQGGGTLDYLDATVDGGPLVFYRELTAAEIDALCDQGRDQQLLAPTIPNFVHGCDFEVDATSGSNVRFTPWQPAGITNDAFKWRYLTTEGASTVAGLLPVVATARVCAYMHRPATSSRDQRRSALVILDAPFSTFGILLRAAQPASGHGLGTGYLVEFGVGSPAPVNVYRVIAGVPTRLGYQPLSGTADITEGLAATLDAAIVDQTGVLGDPAAITVRIDGTVVTLAADPTQPDVGLSIDGALVDSGTNRITSGVTTAFVTAVDTSPTVIDNWTLGALAAVGTSVDYPSAVLPQEGDGAEGDLATVLAVQVPLERSSTTRREQFRTPDGHAVRWLLDSFEPRTYELASVGLTTAERDGFEAFYRAHMPAAVGRTGFSRRIPFTWDPGDAGVPAEPTGIWVFASRVKYGRQGPLHTVAFRIQECVTPVDTEDATAVPTEPPAAPVLASLTPGPERLTASLTAVDPDADYSQLRYDTDPGFSAPLLSSNFTGLTKALLSLDHNNTYYVQARNVNAAGFSDWSNTLSADPDQLAAPVFLGFTVDYTTSTVLGVWASVVGANTYNFRAGYATGLSDIFSVTGQPSPQYLAMKFEAPTAATMYWGCTAVGVNASPESTEEEVEVPEE